MHISNVPGFKMFPDFEWSDFRFPLKLTFANTLLWSLEWDKLGLLQNKLKWGSYFNKTFKKSDLTSSKLTISVKFKTQKQKVQTQHWNCVIYCLLFYLKVGCHYILGWHFGWFFHHVEMQNQKLHNDIVSIWLKSLCSKQRYGCPPVLIT